MNLHTDILSWTAFLDRHEAEWTALWHARGALHDLSPMWARAVVHAHRLPAADLHVLHSRDADGALRLVWPFQRRLQDKGRVRLPCIAPLQTTFCMYADVLSSLPEPAAVVQIHRALRAWRHRWHWIELENLELDSPSMGAWQALAAVQRRTTRLTEGLRSPYLRHEGAIDGFLAGRSKSFRKRVLGRIKEVDGQELRAQSYRTPEELAQFAGLVLDIEARSWKHEAGSSLSTRDFERRFYDDLITRMGPLGGLFGWVLFLGEQPIAYLFDLIHGQRVLSLKGTYDHQHVKRSPGNVLTAFAIARYLELGCTEYDFLGGDEPYKLEWSTTVRPHLHLRIYGHGLVSGALAALERRRARRTAVPAPLPAAPIPTCPLRA